MAVNQELYNLLRDGYDAEQITKMLNEAQAKLDKEVEDAKKAEAESKAREEAIDEARADLQGAIEWYLISLGIAPQEEDDEGWDILSSAIEKSILAVEKSLRNTKVEIKTGKDAADAFKKYETESKRLDNLYKNLFRTWF